MKDLLLALGAKPGSEPAKKPALGLEIEAGPSEELDEEPGMDEAGYHAAASEVMSAFKAGDNALLSEALKSFVEMCK